MIVSEKKGKEINVVDAWYGYTRVITKFYSPEKPGHVLPGTEHISPGNALRLTWKLEYL
jgi:hypothetical protein